MKKFFKYILGSLALFLLLFYIVAYKNCWFNFCYVGKKINVSEPKSEKIYPPEDFKVAFFGDQGVAEDSKAVLNLVKNEDTDAVIHGGDFDYKDDPDGWDKMISDILGENFPYFITVGNHDVPKWTEYQKKFSERLEKINGEKCEGDLGVNSICAYKGLRFILSGVGTLGDDSEKYIEENLPNENYAWQVCAWHKNQKLMQVGGKMDEVGWEAYDICREGGAFIATAHEHSYSRTHLLSDFKNQIVASTENILQIERGKVFAFVSGIGGQSIRSQNEELAKKPWWASVYTATQNAKPGALFCNFNPDGQKNKAECYFKDISGNVPDKFNLVRKE